MAALKRGFTTASGKPISDALRQFGEAKVIPALGRALYREALGIIEQSKGLVPVDTGTLRSSAYVKPPERQGSRITVEFGYGGPAAKINPKTGQSADGYALFVHENLESFHAVGIAKYLELPFLQARPGMSARIVEAMRANLVSATLTQMG